MTLKKKIHALLGMKKCKKTAFILLLEGLSDGAWSKTAKEKTLKESRDIQRNKLVASTKLSDNDTKSCYQANNLYQNDYKTSKRPLCLHILSEIQANVTLWCHKGHRSTDTCLVSTPSKLVSTPLEHLSVPSKQVWGETRSAASLLAGEHRVLFWMLQTQG